MGKVVKAVVGVAALIAIAVAAPYLAGALLGLTGALATSATALIGIGLGLGANYVFQAIGVAPADTASGPRVRTLREDPKTFRLVEVQPEPIVLSPIEAKSLFTAYFFPWQRFSIVRMAGNCLDGVVALNDRWALIDRYELIQPGSLFSFDLDDLWTSYQPNMKWAWWWRVFAVGMVKQYSGMDGERLIFECSNPRTVCETGLNRVRFAYAVVATFPTYRRAFRRMRQLQRAE